MVQLRPVAFFDPGMAAEYIGAGKILPHFRSGYGIRYPVFLGGPNDDDGTRVHAEVPFREVYVHALVRDAEGQKMSKSRGNVIDPLLMMDKYGTDAFRFALTAFAAQGRDIKLSEERIEGYKHFVNKIWNAARLLLMNLQGFEGPVHVPEKTP